MEATIDIDVGGTFTDCLVHADGHIASAKSDTTPYDLSVGFRRALEDAASQLGMSTEELLGMTRAIRYSTTIAMNTLIQRTGPKLGFITTTGHEHVLLIGRSRVWGDALYPHERRHVYKARKPEPLIPIDMVVGVTERVDYKGRILIPVDREEVRERVRYLVDRGARGFVVCLLWSFLNPTNERIVKEVIEEEYPDYYLGNMPVLLSSQVHPKWHEYPRANMTILSAYLHSDMKEQLSELGEWLGDYGYKRPLIIVNNAGGIAKVSRTRPVDTYGAGPIAGLYGVGHISKMLGIDKAIGTDMGGTSFDYGLILNGAPAYQRDWPLVDCWATEQFMIDVRSIGAGGGSLARVNQAMGNKLEVGPKSAGSNPGPACYDLGGTEPTVTDADLLLGYLDPEYFAGGKRRLSVERSRQALDKVARPLGLTAEEAAWSILQICDANMGDVIDKEISLKGFSPAEFTLFAYGGAGPSHCARYGARLRVPRIITFPFSGVFCALGATTLPLKHAYETSRRVTLFDSRSGYTKDFQGFNEAVARLREKAMRDIRSEGFRFEDATLTLELEMKYAVHFPLIRVTAPVLAINSEEDARSIHTAFRDAYVFHYGAIAPMEGVDIFIENFRLFSSIPLPIPAMPVHDLAGEDPKPALRSSRPVFWPEYSSYRDTPAYQAELLRAGNVVHGPAIVEAKDTTVVVPPAYKYSIDRYLFGTLVAE